MQYTSVKIPKVLSKQIIEIIDKNGFTSVTDFVVHATRIHLRKIKELKN